MVTITSIENGTFNVGTGYYSGFDGITITLDDGDTYQYGISNSQDCCETWGYTQLSEDEIAHYIGAEFLGVDQVRCDGTGSYDEGGTCFLDIKTDRGVLTANVYNFHNGYYGHSVTVLHNGKEIQGEGV